MVPKMTMITSSGLTLMLDAETRATRATLDACYQKLSETVTAGAARLAAELTRWERIAAAPVVNREVAS